MADTIQMNARLAEHPSCAMKREMVLTNGERAFVQNFWLPGNAISQTFLRDFVNSAIWVPNGDTRRNLWENYQAFG